MSGYRLNVYFKFVTSEPFFFFYPKIYRFKLWKTVLYPKLHCDQWCHLGISLELWELDEWAAFPNSCMTITWESLTLSEVLENGNANSLVIFLEEFLSSLWRLDRTPIPYIPRVCITKIKYQILKQTKWDIHVLLMDVKR